MQRFLQLLRDHSGSAGCAWLCSYLSFQFFAESLYSVFRLLYKRRRRSPRVLSVRVVCAVLRSLQTRAGRHSRARRLFLRRQLTKHHQNTADPS